MSDDQQEIIEQLRQTQLELARELDSKIKRNISRSFEDIVVFRQLLTNESDRGCALVASSLIEEDLKNLISAYLLEEPKKLKKEVLEGQGPLATFSARISVAYLMGLISEQTYKDCQIIRKIRNLCAHTHQNVDFQTPEIRSRCLELSGRRLQKPTKKFSFLVEEPVDPRHKFIATAIAILAEIHDVWHKSKRPIPLKSKQIDGAKLAETISLISEENDKEKSQ